MSRPAPRYEWVLLGLITAVAAVLYLVQERELKRKKPRSFYPPKLCYRLPLKEFFA